MKEKNDKRSESQFDIPEGVDWSWTAESQEELMRGIESQDTKKKSGSKFPKTQRPF